MISMHYWYAKGAGGDRSNAALRHGSDLYSRGPRSLPDSLVRSSGSRGADRAGAERGREILAPAHDRRPSPRNRRAARIARGRSGADDRGTDALPRTSGRTEAVSDGRREP